MFSWKKVTVGILGAAICLTAIAGCNKNDVPSSGEGGDGPIKFSWFISESWFANKWGEDPTSRYIREKTGVDIDFIVPAGNSEEKLTMMIASKDLPDFLTIPQYSDSYINLRDGGLVQPLNKLADQYDKSFYDSAYQSVLNWYTHTDGNVYAYPNNAEPFELEYNQDVMRSVDVFMVRKDIYEAIGSPDMRTPEGFLDACKKAYEMFPEVNGQPLIPLYAGEFDEKGNRSMEYVLADYLASPIEENGQLLDTLRYRSPDHVKWLKTFRKLNEMGLFSKDNFVDKNAQFTEKVAQGRYFAMMTNLGAIRQPLPLLHSKNPEMTYIAVDGPANSNLSAPKLRGGNLSGWTVTMISNKNKNPERSIKFMSYWMSEEGQKDFFMGAPGVTRETVNGVEKIKDEVYDLRDTNQNEFAKTYACRDIYWMLIDSAMTSYWLKPVEAPFKQPTEFQRGKTVNVSELENLDPSADSKEGIARTKILEKWGKVLPQLLMAKSDSEFDSILNGFWAEEDKARETYAPFLQNQYEINKAKIKK